MSKIAGRDSEDTHSPQGEGWDGEQLGGLLQLPEVSHEDGEVSQESCRGVPHTRPHTNGLQFPLADCTTPNLR